MPIRPPSFRSAFVTLVALAAAAPPQDAVVNVIPGRDFVQRKLLSAGHTDVWKLDVEKDEMLWCAVDGETFDPVLSLVDAHGNEIANHDGPDTHSELWIRAPSTGAYEFRVRPFGTSGSGHYSYRLHRFRTSPLAAEGGEAAHTFAKEQWWHYRVALKEHDVLLPTVLGEGRLTAVLDADRNPLRAWRGGYVAARDGDCYVRVEGAEGRRCQVLTQLARSGTRPFGERFAARAAPYGLDAWRVRMPAGACLQVDVRMPQPGLGVALDEVPEPDQPAALVGHGHFDKGGMLRRLYFARREVTLEIALRNATSSALPYEFGARAWGVDARLGDVFAGVLPLGDGALYHLPLTAGEMVEIAVDSEQFDPKFDLLDPDGNQLVFGVDDRAPLDRGASHRFLVTRPGTWHVIVHCCSGQASGAFTLRTAREAVPRIEPDGERVSVRWGSHMHLDLAQGDVVWLSLATSAFDAALQVFDPAGDGGFVAEGGGLGADVLVAYRASHGGRHTLLVHSRDGRQGDAALRVVRP